MAVIDELKRLAKGQSGNLGFEVLAPAPLLHEVCIEQVQVDPDQPRQQLGDLSSLKASITQYGIVEPLVVMPMVEGKFRLVAGERRYTAARELGLSTVPVVVRQYTEQEVAAVQLIENMHRKELDPFEEAAGYRRLADQHKLVHAEIAKIVGKSRSQVTESLSLLRIPVEIRQKCRTSDIPISRDALLQIAKMNTPEEMLNILELALHKRPKQELRNAARRQQPRRAATGHSEQTLFRGADGISIVARDSAGNPTRKQMIEALQAALKICMGKTRD